MKRKKILVGTSKGLVVYSKISDQWKITNVFFLGLPISAIYIDSQTNSWWISVLPKHWGQKLFYSSNDGKSWAEKSVPQYPQDAKLSSGKSATLKKIWCISGSSRGRERIWVGTEPGGLFQSENNGKSFELVEGLWDHSSRRDQNQWFGAGRDHPFIHSVVIHPDDSNHIYVAVSCAGVFETKDGGKNWRPKNDGLKAAYLPNPSVEIGHDPHQLLICKSEPNVLWQQNHCGIFRSIDGGGHWVDVSDKNGLANYGFALAIDQENSKRAWVIPALSDEVRVAVDLSLCVCETEDGGNTWVPLRNGLPQEHSFDIVFRHAFANYQNEMVFGSTTGNLYFSENYGENWSCLSNNLSRIETVVFAN